MISYVKGRLVDIFGDTIVVEAGSLVEIADGMTAEDVLKASLKHLAFL